LNIALPEMKQSKGGVYGAGVWDGVGVGVGVKEFTVKNTSVKLHGLIVGVGVGVGVGEEVTVGVGVGVGITSQSNSAVKSFKEQFTVGLGVGVGHILPPNNSSQISS